MAFSSIWDCSFSSTSSSSSSASVSPRSSPMMRVSSYMSYTLTCSCWLLDMPRIRSKEPRPSIFYLHIGHVESLSLHSSIQGWQYAWKQASTRSMCLSMQIQHVFNSEALSKSCYSTSFTSSVIYIAAPPLVSSFCWPISWLNWSPFSSSPLGVSPSFSYLTSRQKDSILVSTLSKLYILVMNCFTEWNFRMLIIS